MATEKPVKKVVQSSQPPADAGPGWQPAPEDRSRANRLRLYAIICWVVAIAVECVVIFGLLLKDGVQVNTGAGFAETRYPFMGGTLSQNGLFAWCIVLIVVCGLLAIAGSLMWRRANKIDPASEKDKVRFFVQNQLGAIVSLIAFIPLVVVVLLSKNLKGAQKGIVAAVAVVVLAAATFAGVETNPASSEQYGAEQAVAVAVNGTDSVFWVKGGGVYHLCSDSPDLNRPSKDNQIYSGTVGQAHAAGMSRLTQKTECNYNPSTNTIVSTGTVVTGASPAAPSSTESPK